MKKLTLTLCFIAFNGIGVACAQDVLVQASVGFAGINVRFDEGARRIVQEDVRALMANRKYWEAKLDRCVLYFPVIEGILIDEEIPTDFKYLAAQESSLQPDVVSSSNAVGFWQFKKETAVAFGLRVDEIVDERKNIVSSSRAASRYLRKSQLQFNNWVSSLYSYYLGAGGISKTVPSDWMYAKTILLTANTDRYVLRFFAHKIAIEAAIERHNSANEIVFIEYPKAGGRNLKDVADEMGIDELALKKYNIWVTTEDIPADKEYTLLLPTASDQLDAVRKKAATSKGTSKDGDFAQDDIGFPVLKKASVSIRGVESPLFYEINGLPGIMATKNDDAALMARKSKISFGSFLRYNDLSEDDPIIEGQVYYLAKKAKRAVVPFHTVREGESLWQVSQIYGVRLKHLLKYNRISIRTQRMQIGRVLWLMEKRPKDRPVEIVNAPSQTKPTGEQMRDEPAPIRVRENKTPQTTTERKKYVPKMADPQTDTTPPQDDTKTAAQKTDQKKPKVAPKFDPTDDDRVIVVTDDDQTYTQKKPAETKKVETKKPETSRAETKSNAKTIYHTVDQGQTYYSISKMYDVTIADIQYWNGLTTEDKLSVGQKLAINPVGNTLQNQPQTDKEEYTTHTVQEGETMFRISQQYGVKLEDIRKWNNLPDNGVKIGQQLKIKKK